MNMALRLQPVRLEPLLVIAFLSIADTSFISPILASYATSIGASEFEAGLIVGVYSAVAIPATIIMGYVIDRVGRKKVLAPLFMGDAASIYLYSVSQDPWQLVLARILHAIFDSGVFPASLSIFREAISGMRIGRFMGLYWLFISTAIAIGSSTSSVLVARVGFKIVFMLLSILMIFGLVSSILAKDPYIAPRTRKGISFNALRGYLAALIPTYIAAFALYISIGAVVGSLSSNMIRYLGVDERSAGAATGIYMALATLTSIPANIVTGLVIDRRGARFSLNLGLVFLLASMLMLSLSIDPAARYVAAIVNGIAIAMVLVTSSGIVTNVPDPARASSAAIFNTMLLLGVAIGSPLSGYLAGTGPLMVGGTTIYASFILPAILALVSLMIAIIKSITNNRGKQ